MAIQVRADQLKKGMRCEVLAAGSEVPILAIITKVRDLGNLISVDVRTKVALRLPGWVYRSNYHTIELDGRDPVKVSHLPSESANDTSPAHGARQNPSAQAG